MAYTFDLLTIIVSKVEPEKPLKRVRNHFNQNIMKNNYLNRILVLSILVVFFSCDKESTEVLADLETSEVIAERDLILKETSFLVGKLLTDSAVFEEVLGKMEEADKYDELVSLSYLMDVENSITKSELKAAKNSLTFNKGKGLFKEALLNEIITNSDSYTQISKLMEVKGISNLSINTSKSGTQELIDLLTSQNMQIYYPYEDKTLTSKNGEDFYITYAPTEYAETNEAFKYSSSNTGKDFNLVSVGDVDNDFVDSNRVLIISPIDECDLQFAKCGYTDLDPIGGGGSDPDPLPNGGAKLLNYNVDHSSVEEKDILSTRFAGFKVNGNDWTGFAATHVKLDIYRGATDGKVTIDANGNIKAEAKAFNLMYHRIRAKGARKGWWYDVDIDEEFDDDWNMSENEQAIIVFTKHHLKAEASASFEAKLGIDKDGKVTLEGNVKVTGKVTVGAAKQRTKAQLSRRQVLSTIVGNGTTGETRTSNGVNYNVKRSQIFHYYFKHYYTDL